VIVMTTSGIGRPVLGSGKRLVRLRMPGAGRPFPLTGVVFAIGVLE
jgi:hypothetical protein